MSETQYIGPLDAQVEAGTAETFLAVVAANDVNGFEMGVITDGTAYMTGRAVARLCGTAVSTIINQKDEWAAGKRANKFAQKLQAVGYAASELCFPVKHKNTDALAYPEAVVMALLDYYAFEAVNPSETAQRNFRMLAKAGFRIFVYSSLGYDPTNAVPPQWRSLHDRLLLVTSPVGYFGVFMETAGFVLKRDPCRYGCKSTNCSRYQCRDRMGQTLGEERA